MTRRFFALAVACLCGCAEPRTDVERRRAVPVDASLAARMRRDYAATAARILDAAERNDEGWRKLEQLCDDIGHRLSGSAELDRAVRWAADQMRNDGLDNVRLEPVTVRHWVRGRESLEMISPRPQELVMLGLGGSIATPPEGITAEVVVVRDEAELERLGAGAAGKIVLFNNPMRPYDPQRGAGYGEAVRFRGKGADLASDRGAVACLIRSVTAHSLRTPHTGAMNYAEGKRRIPAAAVTVEDAEHIARLTARGIRVVVRLKMEARDDPPAQSANVIGELRGRERPDEMVIIGGHIDAWDAGHGAHDDGAGCVIAMEAAGLLRRLGLTPRRTIRVVLWTNEENGLGGAKAYAETHAAELANHVAAIEADSGCFAPVGLGVSMLDATRNDRAAAQLSAILALLAPRLQVRGMVGGGGADISTLRPAGVPQLSFEVEGSRYFDYHHSPADTLDKVDPKDLRDCVATMAVASFVLADMPERLGE